jgi:hypothetical protein
MSFIRRFGLSLLLAGAAAVAAAPSALAQSFISFDQAASTMSAFVPSCLTTKIEFFTDPQTATTQVDVFGATAKMDIGYTLTLDAVSGAPLSLSAAPLTDFERASLLPVIPRLQFCTATYGQAAQIAATAMNRTLNRVRLVQLISTNTLLVYFARFDDLVSVNTDAIAGVRLADGFEGEPAARASSAQLASAIGSAQLALGSAWTFLRARAIAQTPAIKLDIVMADPVKGIARNVRVTLGAPNITEVSPPFTPRGNLAADLARLRASRAAGFVSTSTEALTKLNSSATNVRFYDFRFRDLAGAPKWSGSCDSPNVYLSAEFTMFLTANEPAPFAFVWGRREFSLQNADLNFDAQISGMDLAEILNAWGAFYPPYDLNESGAVDGGDLAAILNGWR